MQNILKHQAKGLLQASRDHCDCYMSTINKLKQTNSLVMIMLQDGNKSCEQQCKINRLSTEELKDKDIPGMNYA